MSIFGTINQIKMNNTKIKLILWVWRTAMIVGIVFFLVWLIWQNIVPSGYLKVEKTFCPESRYSILLSSPIGFISDLYPNTRVSNFEIDSRGRCWRSFFADPVYFKIFVPRSFNKIKLKIYYQNEQQPLLQLGMMKVSQGPIDWAFQLQPIENKIFDQLDWSKITKSDIVLWQKNKKFSTIEQFVNNIPSDKRLATFSYDLTPEAIKNPKKIILWNQDTPLKYVDYILARYRSPETDGDLKISATQFYITPEFLNGHQLEFILSAPDLAKNQYQIKIYKIEAELEREPTNLNDLGELLINLFNRVIDKIDL